MVKKKCFENVVIKKDKVILKNSDNLTVVLHKDGTTYGYFDTEKIKVKCSNKDVYDPLIAIALISLKATTYGKVGWKKLKEELKDYIKEMQKM